MIEESFKKLKENINQEYISSLRPFYCILDKGNKNEEINGELLLDIGRFLSISLIKNSLSNLGEGNIKEGLMNLERECKKYVVEVSDRMLGRTLDEIFFLDCIVLVFLDKLRDFIKQIDETLEEKEKGKLIKDGNRMANSGRTGEDTFFITPDNESINKSF